MFNEVNLYYQSSHRLTLRQEANINKALAHVHRGNFTPSCAGFGKETMNMAMPSLTELTENFSLFDDWEERYRYLLDLGKTLPFMDEALKTDASFVKGCLSRVWMVSIPQPDGRIHFIADSDGDITKGLIAVLLSAYQDKTPAEIAAVDIERAFKELGLEEHISPNRRNGFFAMVQKVKMFAA